jgi:hypothetical protein
MYHSSPKTDARIKDLQLLLEHSTEYMWCKCVWRFLSEYILILQFCCIRDMRNTSVTPQPFLFLPSFAFPCVGLISIALLPRAAARGVETKGNSLLRALCGSKSLYFIRSGFIYEVKAGSMVGSSIYTYNHIQ